MCFPLKFKAAISMGISEYAKQRWTQKHSLFLLCVCLFWKTFTIFTINFTSITELHAYIKYASQKNSSGKTYKRNPFEKLAKNLPSASPLVFNNMCVFKVEFDWQDFHASHYLQPLSHFTVFKTLRHEKVLKTFNVLISNFSISEYFDCGAHLPLWSIK